MLIGGMAGWRNGQLSEFGRSTRRQAGVAQHFTKLPLLMMKSSSGLSTFPEAYLLNNSNNNWTTVTNITR
jgi:hypothetical protein